MSLLIALLLLATVGGSASATGAHQTIHTFTGTPAGAQPMSALLEAADGLLYGTTMGGGNDDGGSVYRFDPTTNIVTTLYSFDRDLANPMGHGPKGDLMQARDGYFYGTTAYGGDWDNCPYYGHRGSIFRMDMAGNTTLVHRFSGGLDGELAFAGLVEGPNGTLFGTTRYGGEFGRGTVFRLRRSGNFSILHSFNGEEGQEPLAAMTRGSDGALYGTTNRHISTGYGRGSVFRITVGGTFTNLHTFRFEDGTNPKLRLVQHPQSSLFYGTTEDATPTGFGAIFTIDSAGTFKRIHMFNMYGTTGINPVAGLIVGRDGNLYGTTTGGGLPVGDWNRGVIFKPTPTNQVIVLRTLHEGTDGYLPQTALTQTSNGLLFGTALGGASNLGVIFKHDLNAVASLEQVSIYPAWIIGGAGDDGIATGTIIFDGMAASGGAKVILSSSRPTIVNVPASIRVSAGRASANFQVSSHAVQTTTTVTITARYGGGIRRFQLVVHPAT